MAFTVNGTNISALFAISFIVFVAFDWYLEYSNVIISKKSKGIENFACNLILEGFLTKPEDTWGDMNEQIAL